MYSTGAENKNKAPRQSGFNSWINTHVVKINLSSIHVLDCKTQLQAFDLRQKHPPLEEPHSTLKTLHNPNNYITINMPLQCTILKYNAKNKDILHDILYSMIVIIVIILKT